jgi:hypothetical protein
MPSDHWCLMLGRQKKAILMLSHDVGIAFWRHHMCAVVRISSLLPRRNYEGLAHSPRWDVDCISCSSSICITSNADYSLGALRTCQCWMAHLQLTAGTSHSHPQFLEIAYSFLRSLALLFGGGRILLRWLSTGARTFVADVNGTEIYHNRLVSLFTLDPDPIAQTPKGDRQRLCTLQAQWRSRGAM